MHKGPRRKLMDLPVKERRKRIERDVMRALEDECYSRGKDIESLEKAISNYVDKIESLRSENEKFRKTLEHFRDNFTFSPGTLAQEVLEEAQNE